MQTLTIKPVIGDTLSSPSSLTGGEVWRSTILTPLGFPMCSTHFQSNCPEVLDSSLGYAAEVPTLSGVPLGL